jgi:hypothetical protein
VFIVGQFLIELRQFPIHFLPQHFDKSFFILRQAQRCVVGGSLALEIGGQILVGIPVSIGPDHPDFFAAEPFS